MTEITQFRDIFEQKDPMYVELETALSWIRTGRSKKRIEDVRGALDKDKADAIKKHLPSMLFSGKFKEGRKDSDLIQHSGLIVLDFDDLSNVNGTKERLAKWDFTHAVWVSPRGNGLKMLVKIADGARHREHFAALQDVHPAIDKSGVNVSRVCFESYDPEIYINPDSKVFTTVKKTERIQVRDSAEATAKFRVAVVWLTNKREAFVTGERNIYIFKLASACCRFGIYEEDALGFILDEYGTSTDFTQIEHERAVKSAYRANRDKFDSVSFEKDMLVDKITKSEIKIDQSIYDETIRPRDVIYLDDVKSAAMDIFMNGHPSLYGLGCPLDTYFKAKRGEITLLSGIGNAGKSALNKWMMLMRAIKYGEKFAIFAPEDYPANEYYADLVEMLFGRSCSRFHPDQPDKYAYEAALDWVGKYFFYVYPKDIAPTPEYIKERFLELIIKEKVDGVVIDPFNQMTHNYSGSGGRSDKYLETILADFTRFSQTNDVYFTVIAHPVKLIKNKGDENYPCPDVYDISDGAMWNNKMDNILIYYRPKMQSEPENTACEFHSKKIRRQKIVGIRGMIEFEYVKPKRRFFFDGEDYMEMLIREKKLFF